ncbi:SHOCT domain-containing protein [Rubrobacter tropicus]|uniref:SHOCT domain-containing protein n=1 Tax=Rubrobacter tropicus TaxID=2653851 RepID=A0A6G8QD55_9ACTN|nr:SHOCT domain-containing protein [Rubrobacter tropicus]QIN84440.1 SHOCT domain-containing protein [Rubrobacter tropicus]
MMGGWDGGMMGGWGAFGWLWMIVALLFWGGLLTLIVWAVMRIFPGARTGGEPLERGTQSAEEILRGRFARGEIDAEEYEERRRILHGGA